VLWFLDRTQTDGSTSNCTV